MILRISLRPLDKFFFGGESSFKEIGSEDTRRSTYILHSRLFPQQTGALGLIRNQLLLQSGLLRDNTARVEDRKMAKALIGKHGFRHEKATADFGVINRISPVFLEAEDGMICPLAPRLDCPPGKEGFEQQKITFDESLQPIVEGYTEKKGATAQYQHEKKGNFPLDDCYSQVKQVGITKAARPTGVPVSEKDDEAGYYYQTYLQFKDAPKDSLGIAGFTFFIDLKAENTSEGSTVKWVQGNPSSLGKGEFTLTSGIVEFGGERSSFFMEVQDVQGEDFPLPKVDHKHTKIESPEKKEVCALVCLGPAYVDNLDKLRKLSLFRAMESITFRFLKSTVETQKHQQVERGQAGKQNAQVVLESKLFQLLDRGSTIYFLKENQNEIEKLFHNQSFEQIGYNQYQIV